MRKILIVEDEVIAVFLLRTQIHEMGYFIVDLASNSVEAIKAAKEHNPDIILMHININKQMDGIETMAHIREFSKVPVIFTTAFQDAYIRQRANNITYSKILEKPIDIQTLKKAIEGFLIADKFQNNLYQIKLSKA